MEIQNILNQIDIGSYALPEFQRGYVWNRDQVRKLMNSLYRGYPIGSLLTWVTVTNPHITKGTQELSPGTVNLILDGQQRITTLYGLIRGKAPAFFEGNEAAFTGLYFNLEDEVFEFYMPMKMKDNQNWVNITELMKMGAGNYINDKIKTNTDNSFLISNMDKINRLDNIKNINLHIDQVSGEDKTIDVVVEIFNNVNSGGTKLSKGDLALAKICAQWPKARREFRSILSEFSKAGYEFSLDWLLRCITVYLTGQPYFSPLSNIDIEEIKDAVPKTEALISDILNQIGSRLGLDHNRVLGSKFSIPVMIQIVKTSGGKLESSYEWNKLLYWYINTFLWGRYAGSTESVLSQDLNILNNGEGVDGLIKQLRQQRGNLTITPEDFYGWSRGSRFYPLMYLLTRVNHAIDFGSGIELKDALLGKKSALEIHHIFPKSLLYKAGYSKSQVNSLANYTFLTKETNLKISAKHPNQYLPYYIEKTPGAIESHWIPTDIKLYELNKYEEFLEKRRELLADMANDFLDTLINNQIEEVEIKSYSSLSFNGNTILSDEDEIVLSLMEILDNYDLPTGELSYELVDDHGNILAIFDLAWPNGIQEGLTDPIALMLNNDDNSVYKIVNKNGYKYFTSVNELLIYIKSIYNEIQLPV